MSATNNTRLVFTKAVLWLVLGAAMAVGLARYLLGLGATTALSDLNPWGLWIGFDVLSGVALAAGGFVIAATVYIFHLDRYHPLVRPAVLTAFLGYVAVALGLMVDLGRPWNIWRPIFYWQTDSPLFEVAWCVMLYLTVLALEFLPVVFEGLRWNRAFAFMRRLTLPLVIIGIGLSTLHQSSLGTLFLLQRDRLDPLWFSPLLPLLFFISAVGLGLAMVTLEGVITSWLYRRRPEWPLLRGLTRAAAVVLGLYLVLRLGDLAGRGQLAPAFSGTWPAALFWVELTMCAVLPILLFTLPTLRGRHWAVGTGALLAVGGIVLNRADVGGIAQIPITGVPYVPALTELVMSLGVVSGMALIFLFFVEHLPVWESRPELPGHFTSPMADPVSRTYFGGRWFSSYHMAAAGLVVGLVLGVGILEVTHRDSKLPQPRPVQAARSVAAMRVVGPEGWNTHLLRAPEPATADDVPPGFTTALLIDGDRTQWWVLFDHADHQRRLGGEASCRRCHHWNLAQDRGTPCSTCHRDMYSCRDTFDHADHVAALGGNRGCVRCHEDPKGAVSRATATPCEDCHRKQMSWTKAPVPPPPTTEARTQRGACDACHRASGVHAPEIETSATRSTGVAVPYRYAMHRLCVGCHFRHEQETKVTEPRLSRCANCHPAQPTLPDDPRPAGMVASLETP